MSEYLPPRAPDGNEPGRWEPRPNEGEDQARMVVAARIGAPPTVQAGDQPPRNAQALWSLGLSIGGIALLIVSVGLAFWLTIPVEGVAINLARQGRRRAQTEGIGGLRAARTGRTVAIVGIALAVAVGIGWILVFILGLDVSTDVGRDSPNAPTDLSVLWGLAGRGHL